MKCPECHYENPDSALYCSKCGARFSPGEDVPTVDAETLLSPLRKSRVSSKFAGRYEIIGELGEGGMGRVYRVIDRQIDEEVALKVLKPDIASRKETIDRFRNELKLARKISHPNVCRMYHLGESEGIPFIIMEYVPGEELSAVIREAGRFSVKRTITIARQVCSGLAEAHRIGVIHRDINPHNIMIDKAGKARIMDFGIAHSIETSGGTEEGMIIGTPHYMPPEQVSGQKVDRRSDIYSLGVILFEMLVGRRPFDGATPLSIAVKHKMMPPPDPRELNPQIPETLSRLILKCMEKEREKRYQNAEELGAELEMMEKGVFATGEISFARTEEKKISPVFKRSFKWAAALIVIALIAAGAFYLKKRMSGPEPSYENFVLVDLFSGAPKDVNRDLLEYVVMRSLAASTSLQIFVLEDFVIYRKRKESTEEKLKKPVVSITGEVHPRVTGFELVISVRHKEKIHTERFDCRGYSDLLSNKATQVLSFIIERSGGIIAGIEGKRTFAQIASGNLDALDHFLKGEEAWGKLESDTAYFEYRTAIENDSDFSLAYLRLADVLVFRGDREEAGEKLKAALQKKDKLIKGDLIRLKALMARIDSNPTEERQYLRQLTEAFPFKKEYHYEFAESYFHCADAGEAVKHYSRALYLDPGYALAHNHIAYSYAWMGRHELAEKHFIKYIKLDNTANSYDSLAAGYMFAGRYDEAIEALQKGKKLDPDLDYIYRGIAVNYVMKGSLSKALENFDRQAKVTRLEATKKNAHFYLAYIDYLQGNVDKASKELRSALDFYSQEQYKDRLDESPTRPFWFAGLIAFTRGDGETLRAMLNILGEKIARNEVTATNYFPVYKFYIHLKMLEGYLRGEAGLIMESIDEGKRIGSRMGYWDSIFNMPYFFNEYASVLIKLGKTVEALELLREAEEYNSNYAATHTNLAKIHLIDDDPERARAERDFARDLLSDADEDFILLREL